eukprot:gene11257-15105_t
MNKLLTSALGDELTLLTSTSDSRNGNNDVFSRLYGKRNQPRISNYRQIDRNDLVKEEDSQCTFVPVINLDCPFISDRTLRSLSNGTHTTKRRRRKPPPPPRSGSTSPNRRRSPRRRRDGSVGGPSGGMYSKGLGLQRGPPTEEGTQIYYFDPFNPPSFQTGTYSLGVMTIKPPEDEYEEIEVEEETDAVVSSNNSGQLAPPPLPDWAFSSGGDPSRSGEVAKKPITLNIKKSVKKETAAPAPTGWQAVLAEMERKKAAKEGGLKKVEVVEKKPEPQNKPKKKGGKRVFKDLIEELQYKQAKKRGEIVDSDDEVEVKKNDNNAVVASPEKQLAAIEHKAPSNDESINMVHASISKDSTIDIPKIKSESLESKSEDKSSKPDLSNLKNLFASRSKSVADEEKPGLSEKKTDSKPTKPDLSKLNNLFASKSSDEKPQLPVSLTTSQSSQSIIPNSNDCPHPPPLPKTWPPAPHLTQSVVNSSAPTTFIAKSSSSGNSPAKESVTKIKTTVKKMVKKSSSSDGVPRMIMEVKELPNGYYMVEPTRGMVLPGQIVLGGLTTPALCDAMKSMYNRNNDHENNYQNNTLESMSMDNISVDVSQVEITSHHLTDILANKLTLRDLPLPSNFHSFVERGRRAQMKREQEKELEKSKELRNYDSDSYGSSTNNNNNKKNYNSSLARSLTPTGKRVTIPKEFLSHVDKLLENKPYSFRKPAKSINESDDIIPALSESLPSHVSNSTIHSVAKGADISTAYWVKNLRSDIDTNKKDEHGQLPYSGSTRSKSPTKISNKSKKSINGIIIPSSSQSLASASIISGFETQHNSYMKSNTIRNNYLLNYRPNTEGLAPNLRANNIVEKRQSFREQRKQMEAKKLQEEQEIIKLKKQQLREKALKTAVHVGAVSTKDLKKGSDQVRSHHNKTIMKYKHDPTVGINLEYIAKKAYEDYSNKHLGGYNAHVNTIDNNNYNNNYNNHHNNNNNNKGNRNNYEEYHDNSHDGNLNNNNNNIQSPYPPPPLYDDYEGMEDNYDTDSSPPLPLLSPFPNGDYPMTYHEISQFQQLQFDLQELKNQQNALNFNNQNNYNNHNNLNYYNINNSHLQIGTKLPMNEIQAFEYGIPSSIPSQFQN